MRLNALSPVFTRFIPADPEPGNLYVSMEYRAAVHLCACGCGAKTVTPIGPNDWTLKFDGTVTLRPSVGSGQHVCMSHYYVIDDRIEWLPPLSDRATRTALARDRAAHADPTAPPTSATKPWWHRIWNRISRKDKGTAHG